MAGLHEVGGRRPLLSTERRSGLPPSPLFPHNQPLRSELCRSENNSQRCSPLRERGRSGHLAALYREFHPGLLRYLRAQEPNDGEDLVSETWLDAVAGLDRFQGGEWAFRRWLFTIARRRLIDHRRRGERMRRASRSLDEFGQGPGPDDTEAAVLAANETEAALARIAALPLARQKWFCSVSLPGSKWPTSPRSWGRSLERCACSSIGRFSGSPSSSRVTEDL